MQLDPDARAELVAGIVASLDRPVDADGEPTWDVEIVADSKTACGLTRLTTVTLTHQRPAQADP